MQSTNLFTLCGQEDALATVGSLCPTLVEARARKDALYNSEENGRQSFLGLLQTMTALQPQFHNVTLACDTDYSDSQGDAGSPLQGHVLDSENEILPPPRIRTIHFLRRPVIRGQTWKKANVKQLTEILKCAI